MPKDKNAPKRGMSGFMFFSNARRPELKAENPEWAFGEFGKAIGAEWQQLSDSDKAPYQKKADKDKIRYEKEMENYDPPEDLDTGGKKKKQKKDPNAPKGPKSAYMFFSVVRRPTLAADNPDWAFGEFGKAIGAEWKLMPDSQKTKYVKQAEKDKARYAADMEVYNA
jgi:hypothetical protein